MIQASTHHTFWEVASPLAVRRLIAICTNRNRALFNEMCRGRTPSASFFALGVRMDFEAVETESFIRTAAIVRRRRRTSASLSLSA